MKKRKHDRRGFLALGAGVVGLAACGKETAPSMIGAGLRAYGDRSQREKAARDAKESPTPGTGSTRTPLQDLDGMITPSSLHFERHHAGVPDLDAATHEILVHGLVERPLVFTMADLRRYPSQSHIYFVECSGNSRAEWTGSAPDPQQSAGLMSSSEWTGVPLSALLKEAGLKPQAKWVIAEGGDACMMARSIPVEKCLDDILVAYGQNGEALRPEQGYPVRLVVPGWEGNINVKWLRRLHVVDQPAMTRDETSHYTDLLPDGKARMFTFMMEGKSIITRPAGKQKLAHGPGRYEITGLAWSGYGKITRVEVSTDGGATWADAELQGPVLPRAATRFRTAWNWNGSPAVLQSRCTDESGYRQPTHDELVAARGKFSDYHYNGVKSWFVKADGSVADA
jgi:sulfane dehydrogenase subunit SoxC